MAMRRRSGDARRPGSVQREAVWSQAAGQQARTLERGLTGAQAVVGRANKAIVCLLARLQPGLAVYWQAEGA